MTMQRVVCAFVLAGAWAAAGPAAAQPTTVTGQPATVSPGGSTQSIEAHAWVAEALALRAATMVDAQAIAAEAATLRAGALKLTTEAMAAAERVYLPGAAASGWQPTRVQGVGDQETRVYNEGRAAIDKAQWERAIERYTQVVEMKGPRADAALYWKAFAQDRQGLRADALATIATLGREYSESRYLPQARVLEAEIRQNAGQPVRPQDQADEDLKLMALNALQHTAPEQAVPMLDKLLQGTASPRLKERALFVLAQSNSPQAREVLKGVAKGNSTPELQSRAITYLGQHGGRESRAVLAEIYGSTNDVGVKRGILRAYMVGGEKERLLNAAQSEQHAELRAEAVRQLGTMNAHAELWELYQRESSPDVKKQIIRAMFVGGNATRMTELARTEQNRELRREAIRNLGLMGSKGPADALVDIYASEREPEIKRAVIQALATQNNATALVALARTEQDQALRADIVRRLSTMTRSSKVAADYMIEILGGK